MLFVRYPIIKEGGSWIAHFYVVIYGIVIGKVAIRKNTAGGLAPNCTE